MVLIYSDTAMLVDLLFTQAKQTEEGRRIVLFTLPSLLRKKTQKKQPPLLQVSAVIIAAKTLCFQIHIIAFAPLAAKTHEIIIRAACKSALKLPADKTLQIWRLKWDLKRSI